MMEYWRFAGKNRLQTRQREQRSILYVYILGISNLEGLACRLKQIILITDIKKSSWDIICQSFCDRDQSEQDVFHSYMEREHALYI